MAEVIAKKIGVDLIEPSSAGVTPLGFVPIETSDTLLKNGYLPEVLESKGIHPELCDSAELIINMSGVPREDAFANYDKVEDWTVEDPYHGDLGTYQRAFEDIETRVGKLVDRLRNGFVNKEKS